MQRHYSDFLEAGAELYAISVDAPAESRAFFVDTHGVRFPVLSDQSRETIKAYGVHGGISNIAIPSAFIIDKDGVIRWKFIGDTSTRANVDIMLQQLDELKNAVPDEVGVEIGSIAPDFTLPNTDNESVMLSMHRNVENAILIFYRGQW